MQLPEQVKIGPHIYKVETQAQIRGDKNEELWGQIRHTEAVIAIQTNLPPERMLAVFLHEAVHGIDEYMHLDLSEEQVIRLGSGLAALLLDNNMLRD